MTTTPAMPELPEPDRTMWQHSTQIDHYTADQMRAYALATMQAQPAEVSDADVWELWLRVCAESDNLSTRVMIANFARAILALRPQAVPMTEGWQEVAACPDGDVWFSLSCGHVVMGWKQGPLLLDWEAAVDHDCCSDASAIKAMPVTPPAHHGITAPAGGEGKA